MSDENNVFGEDFMPESKNGDEGLVQDGNPPNNDTPPEDPADVAAPDGQSPLNPSQPPSGFQIPEKVEKILFEIAKKGPLDPIDFEKLEEYRQALHELAESGTPENEEFRRMLIMSLLRSDTWSEAREIFEPSRPQQAREDADAWLILDPEWLETHTPDQQKELFFNDVLRILVTRLDPLSPLADEAGGPLPSPGVQNDWLSLFLEMKFDVAKAVDGYIPDMTGHLMQLRSFVIYRRARAMLEKLWRRCTEFCLVGMVAYGQYHAKYDENFRQQFKNRLELRQQQKLAKEMCEKLVEHCPDVAEYLREYREDIEVELRKSKVCEDSKDEAEASFLHYETADYFARSAFAYLELFRKYKSRHWGMYGLNPAYLEFDEHRLLEVGRLINPTRDEQGKWRGEDVKDDIWDIYKAGPLEPNMPIFGGTQAERYHILSSNVRRFCIHAGSIHPSSDPFENLRNLQNHVANQRIFNTSSLLQEIRKLTKKNESQQQVIVSLYFRHTMEKLAGEGPKGTKAAKQWGNFWKCALETGHRAVVRNGSEHALSSLLERYPHNAAMESTAKFLYSILSCNIHEYFKGEVDLNYPHWDVVQRKILESLMPKSFVGDHVNWNRERARYWCAIDTQTGEIRKIEPRMSTAPSAVAGGTDDLIEPTDVAVAEGTRITETTEPAVAEGTSITDTAEPAVVEGAENVVEPVDTAMAGGTEDITGPAETTSKETGGETRLTLQVDVSFLRP